jgi:hypothetical protein
MPGALTGSPTIQQSGACGYRGDGDGLMRAALRWFGADGSGTCTQVVIEWYARFIARGWSGPRRRHAKKVEYLLE